MSVRQAVPLVADPLHPVDGLAGENLHVGGAYSCALPGHAGAREVLARPFGDRLFFVGEATHAFNSSTAHGAHDSGVRAADQAIASLRVLN